MCSLCTCVEVTVRLLCSPLCWNTTRGKTAGWYHGNTVCCVTQLSRGADPQATKHVRHGS